MEELVNWLVSWNIPYVDEAIARLILYLVLAGLISTVVPGMLIILTWMERKIIARIQDRVGPNRAGPYGLFQGLADMIKMFTKEDITPARADVVPYNIAPALAMISSIMAFAVVPFAPGVVGTEMNLGLLYIIAVGGLGVLSILMGGWASNNKYALLGSFRSVAMLLAYEIPMVIALVIVTTAAGSMSMVTVIEAQSGVWFVVSMPVVALIFFLAGVAETGRSPFDLIEAESELIAGFHTEYSGIKFGLFMIGEYVHMFVLAFFTAILFFGGWQIPLLDVAAMPAPWGSLLGFIALVVKVFVFVFIMMWFRGTLPRFRIDHVLDFGWKFLVPLSLVLLIGVMVTVRLFAPGSTAGVVVEPGPLSQFGQAGEVIGLLLVNVIVAGGALLLVARIARHSRNRALRAVSAAETT